MNNLSRAALALLTRYRVRDYARWLIAYRGVIAGTRFSFELPSPSRFSLIVPVGPQSIIITRACRESLIDRIQGPSVRYNDHPHYTK
jgi:hypothetical protein